MKMNRNARLMGEMLALYLLPALAILYFQPRWALIATLWAGALAAWLLLGGRKFSLQTEWNAAAVNRASLAPMLRRFALAAVFLVAFTIIADPERLFSFPLERPAFWAMVMVLYPVFSALPQELLYRSLFFHRYALLFTDRAQRITINALFFSYAHILFGNWIAVVFTAIGGAFFADTYLRRRSLALATLEHALYGCFVFTLGLGWHFYATAWRIH